MMRDSRFHDRLTTWIWTLFAGALLPCLQLDSAAGDATGNADAHIHYIEAAKLVEPMSPEKAMELAEACFKNKYANNSANYFPAKMDYGYWTGNSHPFTRGITFFPKPGMALSLAVFSGWCCW